MQHILGKVRGRADSAEVFFAKSHQTSVGYEGWKLKKASVVQTEGYALRVIKNGRVGFAATTDPNGIDKMVENALATAQFGEQVNLEFPKKTELPKIALYDKKLEELPITEIIDCGKKFIALCEQFRGIADLEFSTERVITEVKLANSNGFDSGYKKTYLSWGGYLNRVKESDVFMVGDGSAATFLPNMDEELKKMTAPFAEKMALANNLVEIKTGKIPVVFDPRGTLVILLPLRAGASGRALYSGASPLIGKEGVKIFDEKFTLVDDGTLDKRIGSAPFDDEGIAKQRIPIVENGVFHNFLLDLATAAKVGRKSNGCGERGIFSPPGPSFSNVVLSAGKTSKEEMLSSIEEGLYIEGVLGLGQGNILSGTFSNPFGTVFKIEKGKLVGRVKDGTISGNIYEDLKEIAAVGDKQELIWGSFLAPHIRVDNFTVAGK